MYGRFWKNIVITPFFLITAFVCAILLVGENPIQTAQNVAFMGITDYSISIDNLLDDELFNSNLYVILPVIMGIPYITFFYNEIVEKRIRDSLIRTGKDKYVSKHIFQAAFSGMLLAIVVVILSISLSAFLIKIRGTAIYFSGYNPGYLFYDKLAEKGIVWGLFAAKLFMFLCYAAIWPVVAVTAIFFTENRYVATAVPFMVSAILEAAAERFSFEWIRLSNFLGGNWILKKSYGGIPLVISLFMLICSICWILVRIRLDKLDTAVSM